MSASQLNTGPSLTVPVLQVLSKFSYKRERKEIPLPAATQPPLPFLHCLLSSSQLLTHLSITLLVSIFSVWQFSTFSILPVYQMLQICHWTCSVWRAWFSLCFWPWKSCSAYWLSSFADRLVHCPLIFHLNLFFSSTAFKPCHFTASKQFFLSMLIGSLQWNHICGRHCTNRKSLALHCQMELTANPTFPLQFKLPTLHCSMQIAELNCSEELRAKELTGITEK